MKVKKHIKSILNITTDIEDIIISKGLKSHVIKHRHKNILKYFGEIENIVNNPDYVGVNPREKGTSLEYIKILDDNVLLAVKLDSTKKYFYTASIYDITDAKLKSMLASGRIKKL